MSDDIDTIDKLEEQLCINTNLMHRLIDPSKIDNDTLNLIDELMRLNHATVSAIIEYLRNNK